MPGQDHVRVTHITEGNIELQLISVTLAYWIEPSLLNTNTQNNTTGTKSHAFLQFTDRLIHLRRKRSRKVWFALLFPATSKWYANLLHMFRRLIDRNNYIILEQSRKEISDRKTLNGCLQSVWLVLGPDMWCLETFTGSRCQVFVNRFWSHNSWRELRAASIARIFDLPWVGKSLNQSLKLGTNKVLFFVFRYMRFYLEKMTYQKHFYFNENRH